MSAGLVEQVYRYGGASTVAQRDGGASVALATSGGTGEHPRLYAGWIPDAPVQAQALLVVPLPSRSRCRPSALRGATAGRYTPIADGAPE
jgi:hypothetical protein